MVREKLCETEHGLTCRICGGLINVAKHIGENEFIRLNTAFHMLAQLLSINRKMLKGNFYKCP